MMQKNNIKQAEIIDQQATIIRQLNADSAEVLAELECAAKVIHQMSVRIVILQEELEACQ